MAAEVCAPKSCAITAGSLKLTIPARRQKIKYVGSGLGVRSFLKPIFMDSFC